MCRATCSVVVPESSSTESSLSISAAAAWPMRIFSSAYRARLTSIACSVGESAPRFRIAPPEERVQMPFSSRKFRSLRNVCVET
jgi:hypothetical protein